MRGIRLFSPLLLLVSSTAFSETCRHDPDSACVNTDATKYCITFPITEGIVCPVEFGPTNGPQVYVEHTKSYTVAPPIDLVQAVCSFESGHYRCEAWGRGPDVSYTWALNQRPGLSFITPPHGNNEALINCQPNMSNLVYLTVTSKFGLSTTVSTNLYCGAMGEY